MTDLRTRPSYQMARYMAGHQVCRWCHVEVDPRSRAYRTQHLCEYCYDEMPPPLIHKKELLCKPTSPK